MVGEFGGEEIRRWNERKGRRSNRVLHRNNWDIETIVLFHPGQFRVNQLEMRSYDPLFDIKFVVDSICY